MPTVEFDAALMRALRRRARKERTTVERLVERLVTQALQEFDDYDAVKDFRARSGGTTSLVGIKRKIGV
jgi:hypothetical protein